MTSPAASVMWPVPDDLQVPGYQGAEILHLFGVDRPAFDAITHTHATVGLDGDLVDRAGFDAALLAACVVAPKLTEAQAFVVVDQWPAGEVEPLIEACLTLCLPEPIDRAWWRLERDSALRLEMDYCAPIGLAHSVFLGGPGSWTDHDRELALAWQLRKAATHGPCGTRRDQWARDPQAFNGDLWDCPGCLELHRVERAIPDEQRSHVFGYLVPADDDGTDDGDGDED